MYKNILTTKQRKKLEDLWFTYGNNGRYHSMSNHKFIQGFLEHGEDRRGFYRPNEKLVRLVDSILNKKTA